VREILVRRIAFGLAELEECEAIGMNGDSRMRQYSPCEHGRRHCTWAEFLPHEHCNKLNRSH
jgi:hypothetical protein